MLPQMSQTIRPDPSFQFQRSHFIHDDKIKRALPERTVEDHFRERARDDRALVRKLLPDPEPRG